MLCLPVPPWPALGAHAAGAETAPEPPVDPRWNLLKDYCSECHNATDWAGGIAYDTMSPSDIPTEGKTFEAMVSKLRGRMMPPPGKPQPDQKVVDSFVSWMEHGLDEAAATQPDPGNVVLHRLKPHGICPRSARAA